MDLRSRLGEFQVTAEAAALRDALEMARLRFDSVYLISPAHNPIGPFDVQGAYDEASDRRQDLSELMARAYEDAYHQFIEPVVGASGEQLARATSQGPTTCVRRRAPIASSAPEAAATGVGLLFFFLSLSRLEEVGQPLAFSRASSPARA